MVANISGPDFSTLSADQSVDAANDSMVANYNTSVASVQSTGDDPIFSLGIQSRIPDFATFHTHTVDNVIAKELILLVEIKPYSTRRSTDAQIRGQFDEMALQVVTQALFALDESSDISEIQVLCVIGWHWRMLTFRTGQASTNISLRLFRRPIDDGSIMLPRMPQWKFRNDILEASKSDTQDGYTQDYIDALKEAVNGAVQQLIKGYQNVFEFTEGRITAYNPAFMSAWQAVVDKANISRK